MVGPLRFRLAAVLMLAGFSTSPAFSNPLDVLFNRAPEEAAAPAPAKDSAAAEDCLPRPGKPADGQHWFYRLDGHRRCWYLAPEGSAASSKRVHRPAARRRFAVSEENGAAPRKAKVVVDARAELLRPTPEETPQPAQPAPAFKVADSASDPATGAAALVPQPPVLAKPDELTPDNPRQGNVETLLAATPADGDAVAVSERPVTPVPTPTIAGDDGRWWTSTWLGPLLMALGLALLLSSTRPLRRAALAARSSWAREPESRPASLRSESDLQARPRHRRHGRATPPRAARQAIADRSKSAPLGQRDQDMTFQEAIKVLADFDIITVEGGSALTSRRLESASASARTRTKASG